MITRRKAWMKLAVMIADGLPDPREIGFHPDVNLITIILDTPTALASWAAKFEATLDYPFEGNGGYMIHGARKQWFQFNVHLSATGPLDDVAEVDEDLTEVRRLAEEVDR